MNYNQTTIIEANYKDRINNKSKSNDFTVRVPPTILKKGTTIELSGSIVQEVSANSDSVIELSNQNLSTPIINLMCPNNPFSKEVRAIQYS